MKIMQLEARNILNLTAIYLHPKDGVTILAGKNQSGKSAILDALWFALGGTEHLPSQPIRRGADEGTIRLELGEDETELVVHRKITKTGPPSLVVKDADGIPQRNPQAILNDLMGHGFFDPLELVRKPDRARLSTLKELLSSATFPLAGISIDGGILYKGFPLAQESTAMRLKIWAAISIALDPPLKVIVIRDGSLLDADSLQEVARMAEESGFQIIIEVARSTDPSAVVIDAGHIV